MVHLIVQASKYIMILLFMIYTYECFHVFRFNDDEERQNHIYHVQRILLFTIHFDAFLVLYLTSEDKQMISIVSDAGRAIGCNHPLVSFVLQTCVGTCAEQYVYVDLHWLYHIDEIVF